MHLNPSAITSWASLVTMAFFSELLGGHVELASLIWGTSSFVSSPDISAGMGYSATRVLEAQMAA